MKQFIPFLFILSLALSTQAQNYRAKFKLSPKMAAEEEASEQDVKQFEEVQSEMIRKTEARYTYKNLRLYPIRAEQDYAEQNARRGNYVTLKEALKDDRAVVAEKGSMLEPVAFIPNEEDRQSGDRNGRNRVNRQVQNANQSLEQNEEYQVQQVQSNLSGATVNSLVIANTSQDTIFVMAGEVVTGGKQDRVIAQDVILAPGDTTDLGVFCVEKSRWRGNSGKFDGYFAVSQLQLRKAVTESQNQSKVWETVDEITAKNDAQTSTHTYAAIKDAGKTQAEVEEYVKHFEKMTQEEKNAVGVIIVSGNKVVGCDLFGSPDLFARQYPNLLQSYALEAVTSGQPVNISYEEVEAYLEEMLVAEEERSKANPAPGNAVHMYKYD